MDHRIPVRKPNLVLINKSKNKNCRLTDFGVSPDQKEKIKERGNTEKYLDLTREKEKINKKTETLK